MPRIPGLSELEACSCGNAPHYRMNAMFEWQVYCRQCGNKTTYWSNKQDAGLEWDQLGHMKGGMAYGQNHV